VSTWDEALGELREEYLREAPERLARGRAALVSLRAGGLTATPDLTRVFHAFAGSGSTYGFPQVSALGHDGELLCGDLPGLTPAARVDALARCQALLDELQDALAAARGGASAPPPTPLPATPVVAPPKARILVIEDDPAAAEQLRRALEQEGFAVQAAHSLAVAQALLEQGLPDGLVCDVMLPDGESYGLVEGLRTRPGAEELPIVVVSVRAELIDRVEAIHCGADAYFTKPADLQAVVRRLAFLLERHRPEPARVLSVEDDPLQAAFLRAVLHSAGYAFECCEDPRRLDAHLTAFKPELVLMDVVLPGASGYDLARTLRQDERYALLPVVFLTTQGQLRDRLAATRAGGNDHLLKPVSPEVLLNTVAARLEQARFLHSLMDRDGLTGLLNHSALFARAEALVAEARRSNQAAAWIMIDVDHFKHVNDRYGHATGDRVLRSLATLLRRRLRQSDVLGRYGGEEFAALLADLGSADAQRLVDRLRAEFAQLRHEAPGGETFSVTFSAGVAPLRPGARATDWSHDADECLYEAKASGRNRVVARHAP